MKIPGTEIDIPESLELLLCPVSRLSPDERNPRRVKDLTPLKRSLEQFGVRQPIVANLRTGKVEVGHQRLSVLLDAGATHVPVVWVDEDDMQALAYNLADNRTHELVATWDAELLGEVLEGLQSYDIDIGDIGFSQTYLDALMGTSDVDLGLDLPKAAGGGSEGAVGGDFYAVTVYFSDSDDQAEFAQEMAKRGARFTISGSAS